MTTKEFANYIEKSLSASLGDDFDINADDNMRIILAIGSYKISVDMGIETVNVDVYGYSVADTPYNVQMIKSSGGALAVANKMIDADKRFEVITHFSIEYMGDNAEEIGKSLVAVRDFWRKADFDLA